MTSPAERPAVTPPAKLQLRACVDVADLEEGIRFYTEALGLRVGRRLAEGWVELLGAPCPIDLLAKPAGSAPHAGPNAPARRYDRHWTPVHLDFVVTDLDAALRRALAAGAALEGSIREHVWGRIATVADPFGHGLCILEFRGRGYDEVLAPRVAS